MSIAEAGRELGLTPETLRKWQQRYGLGPSRSSAGGHRRYTRSDLLRLRRVCDLIARGVRTAEAARQVLQDEAVGMHTISADPAVRRLAAAAAQLDGPALRHLLDHELGRRGVVDTWQHLLRPILDAIGAYALHSAHGIAMEHVLSHVIQAGLASASSRGAGAPAAASRRIMLACAPDEAHELPLVALAAALLPTRLFAELHQLDQFARLHHCELQLLGLDEAIAAAVRTGPQAVSHDRIQLRVEAGHRSTSDRPVHATRLAASCTTPD